MKKEKMKDYQVFKRERDFRRRNFKERHGKIQDTPQFNAVEAVEIETRGKYITPSETFKEEEGSVEEVDGLGVEICEELRGQGYKGSGIKKTLNRQIWFLLDRGYTYRGVAYELGCDKITVWRHKLKYGRM